MNKREPRGYCSMCGNPVYGNIDPRKELVCSNCTESLTEMIERDEKERIRLAKIERDKKRGKNG